MCDVSKETQLSNEEIGFYDVLGPNNTISDFVTELYDSLFRTILGNDIMDRSLGSFSKDDLFAVMSLIFLQDGNQKLYDLLYDRIKG